jgi:Asp-tRNA(Asn)/Glu-tRNA(Gln) amidotransferase C subunit
MSELTPLENLTNIKDAAASESVGQLFEIVRAAVSTQNVMDYAADSAQNKIDFILDNAVPVNELRDDTVIESSETERQIIIDNFPLSKNNHLVVPKVIEE